MNRWLAILQLIKGFLKNLILSGWETGRLILSEADQPHAGITRMPFGALSEIGAAVLGGLITLTPGTTVIAIDLDRHEFVLHLLDLRRRGQTLASIQRDFVEPLRRL